MSINDMIFVHIPKTGGWSMCNSLKELKYLNWHGHNTAMETMNTIGEETFNDKFSFTIVRNPWDKIQSVYKFLKFGSDIQKIPTKLPENKQFSKLKIKDFDMFIDILYENFKTSGEVLMNTEFLSDSSNKMVMSQHKFIYHNNGTKLVDYVGHLNNLDRMVIEIFYITKIKIPLPKHGNISKLDVSEILLNENNIEKISEMYAEDIEKFNFKYEKR